MIRRARHGDDPCPGGEAVADGSGVGAGADVGAAVGGAVAVTVTVGAAAGGDGWPGTGTPAGPGWPTSTTGGCAPAGPLATVPPDGAPVVPDGPGVAPGTGAALAPGSWPEGCVSGCGAVPAVVRTATAPIPAATAAAPAATAAAPAAQAAGCALTVRANRRGTDRAYCRAAAPGTVPGRPACRDARTAWRAAARRDRVPSSPDT